MDKLTEVEKNIAREIGWYYFNKNKQSKVDADKELSTIGITNIKHDIDTKTLHLYIKRCGIFIGSKGVCIDAFTKHFQSLTHLSIEKIHLHENVIDSYLYSFDVYDNGDYWADEHETFA
jgi:hypothetical protein